MSSSVASTSLLRISNLIASQSVSTKSGEGIAEHVRNLIYTLLSTLFLSRPVPALTSTPRLRIPDLLREWPWPAMTNPAFSDKLRDEEQAFFLALPEVRASKQLQKVVHNSFVPILSALIFPNVTEGQLRVVMKFAQWTILIEDPLEQEDDLQIVNDIVEGSIKSFREPEIIAPRSDEFGRYVSVAAREQFSSRQVYDRFINGVTNGFTPSIMRKATQHKLHTPIPPIEEWLAIRRRNYGLDCFPAFLEFEDPLPEEIIHSPLMQGFIRRAGIMCILANDLYSHNKEQSVGDTYNTLSVVQQQYGLDLNGSVDWLEAEHTRVMREFLADYHNLPSFGSDDLDLRVREWVSDLARMVRGNVEWHFIAPRYFGNDGAQVRKQGYVDLLPRRDAQVKPQPVVKTASHTRGLEN